MVAEVICGNVKISGLVRIEEFLGGYLFLLLYLTPAKFLECLLRDGAEAFGGRRVGVLGDVSLFSENGESLAIDKIPHAIIHGNLFAQNNPFLRECNCEVMGENGGGSGGAVFDNSSVRKLGRMFKAEGTISLRGCREFRRLEGVHCQNIILDDSGIRELGDGVVVTGWLSAQNCRRLQKVGGAYYEGVRIENSGITKFTHKFRCTGNFIMRNCPQLREMGDIGFPHRVTLEEIGLTHIKNGFRCSGDLRLEHCLELEKISNIHVKGSLSVEHSSLQAAEAIEVDQMTRFVDCPALKKVSGKFTWGVDFKTCGLEELGSDINYGARLSIVDCEGLHEIQTEGDGGVELSHLEGLSFIGKKFRCGGTLVVDNCHNLQTIRGVVGGSVILQRAGQRLDLGRDLQIEGGLYCVDWRGGFLVGGKLFCYGDINNTKIAKMEAEVGCDVHLEDCDLEETGRHFQCGNLYLAGCDTLQTIRGRCSGKVRIIHSGVEAVGADFECGGDLFIENCHNLRIINCGVGGVLKVVGCPVARLGPVTRSSV
jgi:hypothetical protein